VSRDDLNTTVSGKAVVAKLIEGSGVSFSSTGADIGTGDVTISVNTASIAGFVKTAPVSVNDSKIIPTVNDQVALTLQPKSTSTLTAVPALQINQKDGSQKTVLNSDGTANFAGQVQAGSLYTQGQNLFYAQADITPIMMKNSTFQSQPMVYFFDNITSATLFQIEANGLTYSRNGYYGGINNGAAGGFVNRGTMTLYQNSSMNSGKGLVLVGYGSQNANVIEFQNNNGLTIFNLTYNTVNGVRMSLGKATPTAQLSVQDDIQFDPLGFVLGNGVTYNDFNIQGKTYIRMNSGTGCTLTGLAGGIDGKILIIINATGGNLTVSNQSTGSVAANRVITGSGANLTLAADQNCILLYDGTTQRWRVIGRS